MRLYDKQLPYYISNKRRVVYFRNKLDSTQILTLCSIEFMVSTTSSSLILCSSVSNYGNPSRQAIVSLVFGVSFTSEIGMFVF